MRDFASAACRERSEKSVPRRGSECRTASRLCSIGSLPCIRSAAQYTGCARTARSARALGEALGGGALPADEMLDLRHESPV